MTAGYLFTCGTQTGGTLWCWGENGYGQLGVAGTYQAAPVQVGTVSSWTGVRAGFDTACASRTDGSLWCWGNNAFGQLADGTTTHRYAPVRIGDATTWTSDTAVGYHNCGIRTGGGLWCWGGNDNGQLGDGTTTLAPGPAAGDRAGLTCERAGLSVSPARPADPQKPGKAPRNWSSDTFPDTATPAGVYCGFNRP